MAAVAAAWCGPRSWAVAGNVAPALRREGPGQGLMAWNTSPSSSIRVGENWPSPWPPSSLLALSARPSLSWPSRCPGQVVVLAYQMTGYNTTLPAPCRSHTSHVGHRLRCGLDRRLPVMASPPTAPLLSIIFQFPRPSQQTFLPGKRPTKPRGDGLGKK